MVVGFGLLGTDGALVVGPSGGSGEKIPGGSDSVGVTEVDAEVSPGTVIGVVEVIPVVGATSDPVAEVGRAAALVAAAAGVFKVVTFWGDGAVSGPAGFSRVHPRATIANNASVAKK